jgi:PTS system nitrogen regulatory IIA component
MMAACAVSPGGVEFEAVDGEPASLFILLVSPESVGTPHVKVLANISRLLKEESVRRNLRQADSPNALLSVIRAAETKFLATTST